MCKGISDRHHPLISIKHYCPNTMARWINTLDAIQIPATAMVPKRNIFSQTGIPFRQTPLVSSPLIFMLDWIISAFCRSGSLMTF